MVPRPHNLQQWLADGPNVLLVRNYAGGSADIYAYLERLISLPARGFQSFQNHRPGLSHGRSDVCVMHSLRALSDASRLQQLASEARPVTGQMPAFPPRCDSACMCHLSPYLQDDVLWMRVGKSVSGRVVLADGEMST